jgi:hypothetical protein
MPPRAARSLRNGARARSSGSVLEEDVHAARLAEAYFRAGNRAAATRAVETYERRFRKAATGSGCSGFK